MSAPKLNWFQMRTERTIAQLLVAAEQVFARDGFEGAQMEAIAKAAGRSKGAIYAHFESKDDLFLALFEDRTHNEVQRCFMTILQCKDREDAVAVLKKILADIAQNRTWILLTMEAKLYALRHPEMRDRWLSANRAFRAETDAYLVERSRLAKLLLGGGARAEAELDARLAAIIPMLTGLVLEAEFEPHLLTKERLAIMLDQMIDTLFAPYEHQIAKTA